MSSQLSHGLPVSGHNWIWAIAVCLLPVLWCGDCIGNDLLIGANQQAFSDDQEEVISQFLTQADDGIIYAFNGPADSAASHLQLQYFLDTPAEFHLNFMFYSAISSPQRYLFHCFVDYKMTPCLKDVGDSDSDWLIFFPNTRYQKKLYFDFDSPGLHDLLIVGVNITDVSARMKYPLNNIVYRANVLVDTVATNNIAYKSVGGVKTQNKFQEIQVNRLEDPATFKHFNEAFDEDCANGLHIHVRNPNEMENRYAILGVAKKYSGESAASQVEFVTVDSKSEISYKFDKIGCGSQGYAFSILVANPYVQLEKDSKIITDVDVSVLLSNIVSCQDEAN